MFAFTLGLITGWCLYRFKSAIISWWGRTQKKIEDLINQANH